jgi:hypothetical protein
MFKFILVLLSSSMTVITSLEVFANTTAIPFGFVLFDSPPFALEKRQQKVCEIPGGRAQFHLASLRLQLTFF